MRYNQLLCSVCYGIAPAPSETNSWFPRAPTFKEKHRPYFLPKLKNIWPIGREDASNCFCRSATASHTSFTLDYTLAHACIVTLFKVKPMMLLQVGMLDLNEAVGKQTTDEFVSEFGSGSCVFFRSDVAESEHIKGTKCGLASIPEYIPWDTILKPMYRTRRRHFSRMLTVRASLWTSLNMSGEHALYRGKEEVPLWCGSRHHG